MDCPNDCKGSATENAESLARVSQNEECNCKLGYSGLDCGLGPIGIVLTITPSLPGIAKLERGAHKGSARNENVN